MFKVEDSQNYSKEQFEGIQAIATAYGDYSKKSYEDTKSFVEKLSGVKSLDKAIEVQTEYAKSAYESFVAESQKIAGLYTDLVKQAYKPLDGVAAPVLHARVDRRALGGESSWSTVVGVQTELAGAPRRRRGGAEVHIRETDHPHEIGGNRAGPVDLDRCAGA